MARLWTRPISPHRRGRRVLPATFDRGAQIVAAEHGRDPTFRDFEPRCNIVVVSASIWGGPLCRRFVFTSACSERLLSAT
jgi:hypothetical protein